MMRERHAFPHAGRRAVAVRNHLIHALEEADCEDDPDLRKSYSPSSWAAAASPASKPSPSSTISIREVKGNYSRLRGEDVRRVLVQSGERILPEMAEPLAVFAQNAPPQTRRRNHLEGPPERRHLERAILKSGAEIPARPSSPPCPRRSAGAQRLVCKRTRAGCWWIPRSA